MINRPVIYVSRIMPFYRVAIMEKLTSKLNYPFVLIHSKSAVPGEKEKEIFSANGVKTIKLNFLGFSIPFSARKYSFGWFKGLFKKLKTENPIAIIAEGESNFINNLIIWYYCKKNNIPFLWWSCGRIRNMPVSLIRKVFYPLLKRILTSASAIIGYSHYACNYYKEAYKIPEDKLFFACNSLLKETVEKNITESINDVPALRKKFEIPLNAPVILYVGAVVKDKRPDFFFEIFTSLKKKLPNLHAFFIGNGNYLDEIKKMAKDSNDFHILGKIIEKTELYFLASDVYIMPGLGGLGLQQAMMCSKPVFCSIADGTELDLVKNNINGNYLEMDEPVSSWVEKLYPILTNTNIKNEMGRKSREIIDNEFNSDIMINQIIKAVEYSISKSKV